MEPRAQPQARDTEKQDTVSEPTPKFQNSSSLSTANTNTPGAANLRGERQDGVAAAASPIKPSILERAWGKLGFNAMVMMFMVKGSLPPTIAIAIYQRYSVAVNYLNLGYVMIVVSILTVPVLPRGKYLMNFFITLVSAHHYFTTCLEDQAEREHFCIK